MRSVFDVALVVVNLAALASLLMLDLVVRSGRKVPAIRRAISARLVVNGGFVVFDGEVSLPFSFTERTP